VTMWKLQKLGKLACRWSPTKTQWRSLQRCPRNLFG